MVVSWVAVLYWGLLISFVLVVCWYLGGGHRIVYAWYFWLVLGLRDFATDVAVAGGGFTPNMRLCQGFDVF